MQSTPRANRPHIAVFGRRNVGKSSLINKLTNQELALVSDIAGTTTDPVYKSMEMLPLGPVVFIDTAGIDDQGKLGELRVKKTMEVIRKTDIAVLVIDYKQGVGKFEKNLFGKLEANNIPIVSVINKSDQIENREDINNKNLNSSIKNMTGDEPLYISSKTGLGINKLRQLIFEKAPEIKEKEVIIGDLIQKEDIVVLVTPIDSAAPKGRLILPQVQTIRDVLDHDGITLVTKEDQLQAALVGLKQNPALVVTDSQAFAEVDAVVPDNILLTGFSILFARYKGDLNIFLKGAITMENLKADARILIAEACTHYRQHDDIGTVKLPRWLRKKFGDKLEFDHVAGREYPDNLTKYDLILHCGGCMLNRKEVISRVKEADRAGVPVINYGMAIAQLHGILDRALKPFAETYKIWLNRSAQKTQ